MANVGYIRVSTVEQNTARQLQDISLDKVFVDKSSSLKKNLPGLTECLNYLREGDVLHVHSIDRLARSLIQLQSIVNKLNAAGVVVHFHAENMVFGSGDKAPSPMQELLFQLLGAFAQFERSISKERQREGIAQSKKEGRHLGRPRKLSLTDREVIQSKLQAGAVPAALAEEYKVSLSSIHKLQKKG